MAVERLMRIFPANIRLYDRCVINYDDNKIIRKMEGQLLKKIYQKYLTHTRITTFLSNSI